VDASQRDHWRPRERTLRQALLLSAWAPAATLAAVLMSHSSTQLADFVRRSVELIAIAAAWWVARTLAAAQAPTAARRRALERGAAHTVAAALAVSGLVTLGLALVRGSGFEPGGDVRIGLAVAVLGAIVNGAFWLRYARYERAAPDVVISAQRRLYRGKAWVDVAVVAALAMVLAAPGHPLTPSVDRSGSLVVGAYLLWSALRTRQGVR
jgi:divalent metal cation (Fe/Co/Zn/Cd) transporter